MKAKIGSERVNMQLIRSAGHERSLRDRQTYKKKDQ